MGRKADVERVRAHVTTLSEHFDSVQVFVTRHAEGDHGGTININIGAGNYFTRAGQVNLWCIQQDQLARLQQTDDHNE